MQRHGCAGRRALELLTRCSYSRAPTSLRDLPHARHADGKWL